MKVSINVDELTALRGMAQAAIAFVSAVNAHEEKAACVAGQAPKQWARLSDAVISYKGIVPPLRT